MARQPYLPHKLEGMIAEFCARGPVTLDALAKHCDRSHDYLARLVRAMKLAGHAIEVDGIGTARAITWREPRERSRREGMPNTKEASVRVHCLECGLPFTAYFATTKRCDDCLAPSGLPGKARAYDSRWQPVFKRNAALEGCLVCGSPRARTRDGRWCHWTHDLPMLEAHEVEALLDQYAAPARDVWGRLIGV